MEGLVNIELYIMYNIMLLPAMLADAIRRFILSVWVNISVSIIKQRNAWTNGFPMELGLMGVYVEKLQNI